MKHTSENAIYYLSYPRSGSNWFRYCFDTITETESDKDILFHAHRLTNDNWDIKNNTDIKSIYMLRNYKECIISEMRSVYMRPLEELNKTSQFLFGQDFNPATRRAIFFSWNYTEIIKYLSAQYDSNFHKLHPDDWRALIYAMIKNQDHYAWQNPALKTYIDATETRTRLHSCWEGKQEKRIFDPDTMCKLLNEQTNVEEIFGDFVLPGYPTFDYNHEELFELSPYYIEDILTESAANNYHFALQLIRYYEILEHYDKISNTNPDNTLLVRYEAFVENPYNELLKVIEFLQHTNIVTPNNIKKINDNLDKFMDNIEEHQNTSIIKYRLPTWKKGWLIAHSYSQDPNYNFHSSGCRKEFLTKIDNVLKNKNLVLYNKYLSDYEEK